MSSSIEWTDETWNPVVGCAKVSEGCRNCYAMKEAHRLAGNPNRKISSVYEGLTRNVSGKGPQWTGTVKTLPDRLEQPLRWRKPRRVFVNSMSDLFHPDVPDEFIAAVFGVMALAWRHQFQVLTKRPERAEGLLGAWSEDPASVLIDGLHLHDFSDEAFVYVGNYVDGWNRPQGLDDGNPADGSVKRWPLPNVWLGTSLEDQASAEERVPHLVRTPAAIRWLSCEPLLGPLALDYDWLWPPNPDLLPLDGEYRLPGVRWVVVGGESGRDARPFDLVWARSLVEQCSGAGVPVFVKQLGANPRIGYYAWREYAESLGIEHGPEVEVYVGSGRWWEPDHRGVNYGQPPLEAEVRFPLRNRKGGDPSEWPEDLRVREWPR